MRARIADSEKIRWYHFLPLLLTVEALLWFAWVVVTGPPKMTGLWYAPAVTMIVTALALAWICSFVCRQHAGIGALVAMYICVVWGKGPRKVHTGGIDRTEADRENLVQETGIANADMLLFGFLVLGFVCAVWKHGLVLRGDALPAIELVGIALAVLAVFPGVPTIHVEDWNLRPIVPDEERTAHLIRILDRRTSSIGESAEDMESPSSADTLKSVRQRSHGAVLKALRNERGAKASSEKTDADKIVRTFLIPILRTPIALENDTFAAHPEKIADEEITLRIERSRVESLRHKNLSQPLAFRESLDDHIVNSRSHEVFELCVTLEALFRRYRLTAWDRLQTILGFCQEPNIKYVHDDSPESMEDLGGVRVGDYCRYPLETLVDKKGDCDCHTILAASLFYTLGYDSCVFFLQSKDRNETHMALGVLPPGANILIPDSVNPRIGNRRYYYCETTGSWLVGRIPENLDTTTIEVWWPRRT